jgi:LuxR family maltose regulon positive regulatory protein
MADLTHARAEDSAAVGDGAGGDAAVLSTKLHVPRPPSAFVSRPRLADRLDMARPGTVVLVCAPAGCGKSVLVADWCRRRSSPVAWLSLDSDDNDPTRFWRHLAASIGRSLVGDSTFESADAGRLIAGGRDQSSDEMAIAVLNAIGDEFDDLVLVFEDYHVIDDEDVHAGVRVLLEHAPEQLRVVVISRADPPLLLARRRARGELSEVRAADLRFSADEAAEFLAGVLGGDLPEDTVATLADRTEGWAVGLQLAALSLQGRDEVSAFVSTFSGSHRFVLDYLTEEVLDRQPDLVREFLLSTSILERLSGPLCDAVTGSDDGQEMLEACERANLFVVPLDDERRWWRYHHLFAELLRSRLARRPPEAVRDLHRRAAAWHEAHGHVDRAIDHATAAGDPGWAMRLIERHADELLLRREGATLRRRLAGLPDGVEASRRLQVAHARTAAYAGRPTEADALLDAAAKTAPDRDEQFEPSIDRAASPLATLDPTTALMRAFVAHLRGETDEAVALALQALRDLDDDGSAAALIAQLHLATAPWMRGAVDVAVPALASNVERWRALGDPGRVAFACHYLARAQRTRGDLDAATETYRTALLIQDAQTSSSAPSTGVAHIGLAEIAYVRNDLVDARRHLEPGIAASRQLVYSQALSSGLATLAQIRRAERDPDGARTALDEAIEIGPDADVVDLINPVPVLRAQLMLADGDLGPAEHWVKHRGVDADDRPHHPLEPAHLLLARLMISQGRGTRTLPLLDRLLDTAITDGRTGSVIEIQILRALALRGDDPSSAVQTLARAVTLGAPQRHVRLFVDEGAPMAALLADLVSTTATDDVDRRVLDDIADLIRAVEREPNAARADDTARQPLVVPLTERELEVLAHLATGKANREIAGELYVSLNTIKKHMTHILDKLGAPNRTAAVDRARALDLLP